MKKTTLQLKHSISRLSCPLALLLVPIALVCFVVSATTWATCQEGCFANSNTVLGDGALPNTTSLANTAMGSGALLGNGSGSYNTAIGFEALFNNRTGDENVAVGSQALWNNRTGINNTAIGNLTLFDNTSGNNNIALGDQAGGGLTTGDYNIDIGADVGGIAGESNTIRIGKLGNQTATFIAGIGGVPISGAMAVGVNSSGQLGVRASSARYKDAIQPMDKASEAILALKPVTFRYKKEIDPNRTPEFGLVAEDVEKVNPDLVARDDRGKPFTVRYEAVNAMLLNEFLKEHREVQELKKQVAALATGLQKVSAQLTAASPPDGGLELSKFATGRIRRGGPAPQTVLNDQ